MPKHTSKSIAAAHAGQVGGYNVEMRSEHGDNVPKLVGGGRETVEQKQ
jgi:hypothetical protein